MKRRTKHPRDQDPSPFTQALDRFCLLSGACCAALVDGEGETVDYGGTGDPYDIRVLAAEWRLVLQYSATSPHLNDATDFLVRAQRKSFALEALPEGYALVAELPRRAATVSERALSHTRRLLCEEAGFGTPPGKRAAWNNVTVREDGSRRHRPLEVSLDGQWHAIEILGVLVEHSARRRDLGYRIRLQSGQERTLVREALGHWYLEEEPFY